MVENLIWSVDSRGLLGEKLPVDFRWISGNHNETAGGFPVDFQFSLFFTERPVMHFIDQTCFSPSFHRGFHHFFTIFSPQFSPFFHPSFHSSFHSRFSQQVFTPVFTEIFIEVLRFSPTCSVVDFWLIGLLVDFWLISGRLASGWFLVGWLVWRLLADCWLVACWLVSCLVAGWLSFCKGLRRCETELCENSNSHLTSYCPALVRFCLEHCDP